MRRPTRKRRLAAVLLLATASVAALGAGAAASTGALGAPQTLSGARQAMAAVANFTANGFILDGGARLGFLIHSAEHGNAADGRFSSSSKGTYGFLGSYSFVRIGATFYLDGDSRFWLSAAPALSPSELAQLREKWIRLPGREVRSIATITGSMTNPHRMASLIGADSPASSFAFGRSAILHGQRVLTLRSSRELVYLSATAPHLPMEYVEHAGRSKTVMELGYPAALRIAPPRTSAAGSPATSATPPPPASSSSTG